MKRSLAYVGVGLVSLSVLMLQLVLTRLFSATMYYHFAFLAISLALFGAGASGVAMYLLGPRLRRWRAAGLLAVLTALFAVATVLALLVVLHNPLSPVEPGRLTLVKLARIYGAAAFAFLCAGGAVTVAVSAFGRDMSRLYFFDLAGAAAGCLLLIPVLDLLGAPNTVLFVAVVAASAAVLFASAGLERPRRRWPMVTAGALAVALAALLAANLAGGRLDVRTAKGLVEAGNVIFARWNSFSRVTVWGSLSNDSVLIMIDADAATVLSRDGRDLLRHAHEAGRVEALAYHVRPGARALIIGPGGGTDVIRARLLGAGDITAVEVNPIIARDIASAEPFRSYSGAVFEQPGVRLVVDEARSFIRRSRARWDVIQGTMVDTWAATAAGAFALTENNLYTVEAFEDYLAHLDEQGVLSLTRWLLDPPDQLLRLVSLARASLAALGRPDASRHVMVVRGPWERGSNRAAATFLLKKAPFTDDEVRRVEDVARRHGFALLYTPLTRPPNDFTRLLEAPDPEGFWRNFPSDIAPPRDDSPFFFHTVRVDRLADALASVGERRKTNLGTFVLFSLLGITAAVTLLFILGPLAVARGRDLAGGTGRKLRAILYFACLGAGFIIVEVALVQKCILFLGHPVYSLAVVLFALLVFSGLGSALSGRLADARLDGALPRVVLTVAALVVAAVLALSPVFYALVHLERAWRIAVTVVLLAPLGLVMGMPMPMGIRLLSLRAPEIVPWAWGVNGAASVLGSVAALAIAMLSGFDTALMAAAGLYVLAMAAGVRPGKGPRPVDSI